MNTVKIKTKLNTIGNIEKEYEYLNHFFESLPKLYKEHVDFIDTKRYNDPRHYFIQIDKELAKKISENIKVDIIGKYVYLDCEFQIDAYRHYLRSLNKKTPTKRSETGLDDSEFILQSAFEVLRDCAMVIKMKFDEGDYFPIKGMDYYIWQTIVKKDLIRFKVV